MKFLQPTLENERAILAPLQQADFQPLYQIAADPLIWAQHPNKNRWEIEVFRNFFNGAMESGGAFTVKDKTSGKLAGCTRFTTMRKLKNLFSLDIHFTAVSSGVPG